MAKPKLTAIVIDALEDIKAKEIKLINVSKITSVFDYIAVACGDSNRQTKALANNVMEKVKEAGYQIYGIEGEQTGEWVLVDCGDVVVHIMQPAVRDYYQLEDLWRDGTQEFPVIAPKRAPKAAATEGSPRGTPAKDKKPAAGKTAKKPAAKKPVTKKTAAKKPAAKKPATGAKTKTATVAKKKPVAKKPAVRKTKKAAE